MAKLAILNSFSQTAWQLEGEKLKIGIEVFRIVFGAIHQEVILSVFSCAVFSQDSDILLCM